MDQIFGWDTAGGLGLLLAGLGVFFWGLQFTSRELWRGGRWSRKEESKK